MYADILYEEEEIEEIDIWYYLYTYQEYVFIIIGILCLKYFIGINLFKWFLTK